MQSYKKNFPRSTAGYMPAPRAERGVPGGSLWEPKFEISNYFEFQS